MTDYIYIRANEYWDANDVCKMGRTKNIVNRKSNYMTSEIKRGKFEVVIEILENNDYNSVVIEKILKIFQKL